MQLCQDNVPEGFEAFDRIVVDETQDLTLRELAVVVELCLAIARHRGLAPRLLLSADAGQTVRPTDFDQGSVNRLLSNRLAHPQEFSLTSKLRCPRRIAAVIERASRLYVQLDKTKRPTDQRYTVSEQHTEAYLLHVEVSDYAGAIELIDRLRTESVAVISPSSEMPDWMPASLQDMVLTSDECKGLEYQFVCVLNPGAL